LWKANIDTHVQPGPTDEEALLFEHEVVKLQKAKREKAKAEVIKLGEEQKSMKGAKPKPGAKVIKSEDAAHEGEVAKGASIDKNDEDDVLSSESDNGDDDTLDVHAYANNRILCALVGTKTRRKTEQAELECGIVSVRGRDYVFSNAIVKLKCQ
jgi:hypothetical protein